MDNILIVTEYGIAARQKELRATRQRVSLGKPGGVLALVSSAAGTLRRVSAAVEAWARRPRNGGTESTAQWLAGTRR
jgi:hypothetical protein